MRCVLLFLTLLCGPLMAARTELYVQTTGNQLNSGSTNSDAAAFTYAGGTFVRSTRVFTVASGDPSSDFTVDGTQFASVYTTAGATVATYVARITARDATTITLDATALAGATSTVSESAGAATLKIGGAWKGPNGTDYHPFGFAASTLQNASGHLPRVNVKTGTYAVTGAGPTDSLASVLYEGYTTEPGDGALDMTLPNITGSTDDLPYIMLTFSGARREFKFLQFTRNGVDSPGPNVAGGQMVIVTGQSPYFYGCRFKNGWRDGLRTSGDGALVVSCEAVGCNVDAANGFGGFHAIGATTYINCWAHHMYKAGDAGSTGFVFEAGAGKRVTYIGCIASHNGGQGYWNAASACVVTMINCVAAYNDLSGVEFATGGGTSMSLIQNCAFIENGEHGIRYLNGTWAAWAVNNAFYSNTDGEIGQGIADMATGSVTLTGDPFLNGPLGNLTPDTTTGEGAALRGAGFASYLLDTSASTAVSAAYSAAVTASPGTPVGAIIPAANTGSVIFGTPP